MIVILFKRGDTQMFKLTFDEYIKNPNHSRTRIVGEEQIARQIYNQKFNNMMLKHVGSFKTIMMRKSEEEYYLYVKIPSEHTDKIFYDVVIQFTTNKEQSMKVNNLNSYQIKLFSNDPNFIFTYAYTFNKEKFLIPQLESKIGKKALNDRPKITNPKGMNGYIKSIYLTYLWYKLKGLDKKIMWKVNSVPYNEKFLLDKIMHASDKLTQLQQAQYIQTHMKNKKSNIGSTNIDINNSQDLNNKYKQYATQVRTVKKTNMVNRTMGVKRTKYTAKRR